MIGAPIGDDLAPGDADDPFDDADGDGRILQHRTLLDVQLQVGGDRTGAVAALALVADPLQLVAEGGAIAIGPPVDVLRREAASHGAGGEHRRLEANSSSFVQLTSSSGRRVVTPVSLSVRMTSNAARTP